MVLGTWRYSVPLCTRYFDELGPWGTRSLEVLDTSRCSDRCRSHWRGCSETSPDSSFYSRWYTIRTATVIIKTSGQWSGLHRRQQQNKKIVQSDRQQAGTLPTLPVSCLQQENRLSLIVSDLSTNCRAYLQRLTIQKLFICYSLFKTSAAKGRSHLYAGKISTMNIHA